jgi:hypothetical protein
LFSLLWFGRDEGTFVEQGGEGDGDVVAGDVISEQGGDVRQPGEKVFDGEIFGVAIEFSSVAHACCRKIGQSGGAHFFVGHVWDIVRANVVLGWMGTTGGDDGVHKVLL